jgi:hypothetical protein
MLDHGDDSDAIPHRRSAMTAPQLRWTQHLVPPLLSAGGDIAERGHPLVNLAGAAYVPSVVTPKYVSIIPEVDINGEAADKYFLRH